MDPCGPVGLLSRRWLVGTGQLHLCVRGKLVGGRLPIGSGHQPEPLLGFPYPDGRFPGPELLCRSRDPDVAAVGHNGDLLAAGRPGGNTTTPTCGERYRKFGFPIREQGAGPARPGESPAVLPAVTPDAAWGKGGLGAFQLRRRPDHQGRRADHGGGCGDQTHRLQQVVEFLF